MYGVLETHEQEPPLKIKKGRGEGLTRGGQGNDGFPGKFLLPLKIQRLRPMITFIFLNFCVGARGGCGGEFGAGGKLPMQTCAH